MRNIFRFLLVVICLATSVNPSLAQWIQKFAPECSTNSFSINPNGTVGTNHFVVTSNTAKGDTQIRSGTFLLGTISGDTIWVNPGEGILEITIMGDTLDNGQRADLNRVYILKRGARYLMDTLITTTGYALNLVGEPAPTIGHDPGPAVIQLNSYTAGPLLDIYGDLTMQNVWVLAWNLLSKMHKQCFFLVDIESAGSHVNVDHCLFEWGTGIALQVEQAGTEVYIKNCYLRNQVDPLQWWVGRLIFYDAARSSSCRGDTLVLENNTLENFGLGMVETAYGCTNDVGINFLLCNHNTIVNCAKFPILSYLLTEAYIGNNLFVNCHFAAERMGDRYYQDADTLLFGQTINLDTLVIGGATLKATDPRELARKLIFNNNAVYFDTTDFYPFYRSYNRTVSSPNDQIVPEPVMNSRTMNMFSWHPNFRNQNNQYGVNPNFASPQQNLSLIMQWLPAMYQSPGPGGSDETGLWGGYWATDPDSLNNPSAGESPQDLTLIYNNSTNGFYPFPEDLSYSTASPLYTGGTRGFPIGDLNWFPSRKAEWSEAGDVAVFDSILGIPVDVRVEPVEPQKYALLQNFPNPFNPSTVISYQLSANSFVTLKVYDMLGREITTLINESQSTGIHSMKFNAANLPSGVYFYRLQAGTFTETKKLMVIK